MSGRSGYGRSKIVGKLIHLPANMMMAGLAPKVGKPGWAIRLYWQRVDDCCADSCRSEPITLLKRYLTAGRWPTGITYGNDPSGNVVIPTTTGNAAADAETFATTAQGGGTQGGGAMSPYYILIFDKIVTSPFAPAANQALVPLQIFKGDNTAGPVGTITIPATDYKYMTWAGAGTALGLSTEEFNTLQVPPQDPSSGWTIDIDGVFGDDTVGADKWHPVNCPNADSRVGGIQVAFPTAGGWVGSGGPGVPPGHLSKWGPDITYIVDKDVPIHFPGAPNGKSAIVFHIGDLLVNSWQNNSLSLTSIQFGASPYKELMLLVDATTNPVSQPPRTKNNISTTYKTPSGLPKGATINTEDDCFGDPVTAPIASFNIPVSSGTPILEPLPV